MYFWGDKKLELFGQKNLVVRYSDCKAEALL